MQCSECKNDYPARFIELMAHEGGYIASCPECALKIINEVHGLNRKGFSEGSMAQEKLEEFRRYKDEVR